MERITDDQLQALFVFFKPFKGSIAKHLESALIELLERRAEDAGRIKALDTARRMIEKRGIQP